MSVYWDYEAGEWVQHFTASDISEILYRLLAEVQYEVAPGKGGTERYVNDEGEVRYRDIPNNKIGGKPHPYQNPTFVLEEDELDEAYAMYGCVF